MIRRSGEGGIAMIVVLLMMLLVSTLLVGFTASIMSDQHFRFIDREHIQAFYAAHAGIEKLTTDLGNMFQTNFAPKAADIAALTATAPSMPGIAFTAASGGSGYLITYPPDINLNPLASTVPVNSGPYQGLIALITPYTIDVTAQTGLGGEVHLTRQMETVAIPVFQFGMFSSTDLSFFAGNNFNFGGRIATNGNLFLAAGVGTTLTVQSNATAALEVITQDMSNGNSINSAPAHTGTVSVDTAPNTYRTLAPAEGSLVGFVGSAPNPNWTSLSMTSYNGLIRNGLTGGRPLTLPVAAAPGGSNADIVRRPCSPGTPSTVGQVTSVPCTENLTNLIFNERFFTKTSLRILLSDTALDITNLPTIVAATPPVLLDGNWNTAVPNNGTAYGPIGVLNPPIATSPGVTTATTNANTPNAPASQISVAAIPAGFQIPPGMSSTNGGNINVGTITCTGRTATTFFGCGGFTGGKIPAGAGTIITANVPSGNGTISVTTTTTAAQVMIAKLAAPPQTLNVVRTAAFAPTSFWLPSTAQPGGQVVSCSGYSTTAAPINTFTGCMNVPASVFPKTITTNALSSAGTGTIGGYLKVEMQNNAGVWTDVTMEMLNYGIGGPNLGDPSNGGVICADPTPNAILRMQRLKDNSGLTDPVAAVPPNCDYSPGITLANNSNDYWPNVLFDPREGTTRGTAPAIASQVVLGGVIYYIALDVKNLSLWFKGLAPYTAGTGVNALNSSGTGYSVYFSDRRQNNNAASLETGDYGWEDIINPVDVNGVANGVLDAGEDVNANGVLDTYGQFPSWTLGAARALPSTAPPGALAPLDITARPTTALNPAQAQVNRPILFRRALKLINGALGNIVAPGLTIVTENPVYLQGDWNMNVATPVAGDGHVATSIIADAVTVLTNNWNDDTMFQNPYSPTSRPRSTNSYYRVAIIAGKNISFPYNPGPAAWSAASDFGTDGGAHNFLRMLEGNNQTVNYLGSIATFYFSRQAAGIYKAGSSALYDPPVRAFKFDTDFLTPALLPPLTPVFRDVDDTGFTMEIRPGK